MTDTVPEFVRHVNQQTCLQYFHIHGCRPIVDDALWQIVLQMSIEVSMLQHFQYFRHFYRLLWSSRFDIQRLLKRAK